MPVHDQIMAAELFAGLGAEHLRRLAGIGKTMTLRSGEYLFLLGDSAQYVSVVSSGLVELCCPISVGGEVKDIAVEAAGPGKTVGWSALVRPFRFTLSARASRATEVVAFSRPELLQLFAGNPDLERVLLDRVTELIANRLTMFQALWMRELLRVFDPAGQPPEP
ncbi:MAG: cyclic nucleotide-binding domain-containing protein [Acidobacteriota bacterium]